MRSSHLFLVLTLCGLSFPDSRVDKVSCFVFSFIFCLTESTDSYHCLGLHSFEDLLFGLFSLRLHFKDVLSVLLSPRLETTKEGDTHLCIYNCGKPLTMEECDLPIALVEAFRQLIEATFFEPLDISIRDQEVATIAILLYKYSRE